MTLTIDVAQAGRWIVGALFLGFTLFVVTMGALRMRHWWASRRFGRDERAVFRARWTEIEASLNQPGELGRKMAVFEADKLLDMALKSLNMPGETLGERLKYAAYGYPQVRRVWWAHKVRNQLAHEATFALDARTARQAIRDFRRALELLGAI